ncbi:hypothetical protein AB0M42_00740 [Streptomyces sp. NPDC051784]|uniref:hypothetical protein n=1 Tax=Streptomyces sp. NPDC051784 TaxID=3155805 RepID=UPI00341E9F25
MEQEPGVAVAAKGCVSCIVLAVVGVVLVTALFQWIDPVGLLFAVVVGLAFWALMRFQGSGGSKG